MRIKKITKRINKDEILPKYPSLNKLLDKMNKILIYRKWGGVGDIINTRPLFKNIIKHYPHLNITYAIPIQYIDLVNDIEYIDRIIDIKQVDINEYGYVSDISSDCGKYENIKAPYVDKHRTEIWSEISIGLPINEPYFKFNLDNSFINYCKDKLKNIYDEKIKIAIFPRSASRSKDLPNDILFQLVDLFKQDNLTPCIIDNCKSISNLTVPFLYNLNLKEFIYTTSLFDYIISVDTGAFHLSSALEIPTVGIFTWTDSKILSKYHKKVELVQKHRDDQNGLSHCPCWNWVCCECKEKPQFPLKCMKLITANEIYQKFQLLQNRYPKENN